MTEKRGRAAAPGWVRSWSAAPQHVGEGVAAVTDVTLRQQVRLSSGGDRIRVRLSQECGAPGVRIGAARVGIAGPDGRVQPGTGRALTFAGSPGAHLPAGAPLLSDEVALPVPPSATLVVSLHLPGRVEGGTCHALVAGPGWVVPGEHTADADLPPEARPLPYRMLLSAVETRTEAGTRGIVAIGDSLTDGAGAAPPGGWPERLAGRLTRQGGAPAAVANQGISGNRVLDDGFGASALARLDRDVLALPGVTHLIVSEGINDIAFSIAPAASTAAGGLAAVMRTDGEPGPADLIAGYRQIITRAHDHGVTVLGATLTPYGGSELCTEAGEAARRRINDWIRTAGGFDGVLDFDAVWRDPERPDRIRDGLHGGDHLHGSDAGYAALADSVDLGLFG